MQRTRHATRLVLAVLAAVPLRLAGHAIGARRLRQAFTGAVAMAPATQPRGLRNALAARWAHVGACGHGHYVYWHAMAMAWPRLYNG